MLSFLLSVCAGWLVVPDPGGVPPRASGAEGERDRRGDVDCEGQRGSSSFGDGHRSQTAAHKHAAWVRTLSVTFIYDVYNDRAFVS